MILSRYLHSIFIFEDNIFKVFFDLRIQHEIHGSKTWPKYLQIWQKIFEKVELCRVHGYFASLPPPLYLTALGFFCGGGLLFQ